MRTDRYTKAVLTVIAIGLWALTFSQLEAPEVMAAEGQPDAPLAAEPQQALDQAAPPVQAAIGPTSTLPLRWRVAFAALRTGSFDTWCSTAVVVVNPTASTVSVDVEWLKGGGVSEDLINASIGAYGRWAWNLQGSSVSVNNLPYTVGETTYADDFYGYARVTADDPRIMVSAFLYCRTGAGFTGPTILSQTNIPAYPVGATMQYFQAGMPTAWTPPMVEVPE